MKKGLIFLSFLLFVNFCVFSDDLNKQDDKKLHMGFIFSTPNILLDIDEYNGGVGFKMKFPDFSLRFMGDFGYSSSTDIISFDLGASIEKPFRDGRISPYIGGGILAGIENERVEIDADNWTTQLTIPFEASGYLGVEFFLLEFLSVFAEYEVALRFNSIKVSESINGTVTDTSNWNWDVNTGIGNSGRLGFVIYFDNVIEIEKLN